MNMSLPELQEYLHELEETPTSQVSIHGSVARGFFVLPLGKPVKMSLPKRRVLSRHEGNVALALNWPETYYPRGRPPYREATPEELEAEQHNIPGDSL